MEQEQVMKWAREAGFRVAEFTGGKRVGKQSVFDSGDIDILGDLKRFATLVAQHEREQCAKEAERVTRFDAGVAGLDLRDACATAIRARGNTTN